MLKCAQDRTLLQRGTFFRTFEEFDERKNNGESNLRIKLINGIPQIKVRSLKHKDNGFKQTVCENSLQFDIIAFTETLLDEKIQDSELFLLDYKIIRSDRDFEKTGKCPGGLLLQIKSCIKCRVIHKFQFGIKLLSVLLNVHGQNVMFTLTYVPPFEHKRQTTYLEIIFIWKLRR